MKPVLISTKEAQKRAFAGVGSPRNPLVCRVSTLNLARRHADATQIANTAAPMSHGRLGSLVYGRSPYTGRSHAGSKVQSKDHHTANAGATPKLTMSAKLSSCAPSGVPPPKALAASPSNTSKTAARKINPHAIVSCPCEAKRMEATPQARFAVVSRSGMRGKRANRLSAKSPTGVGAREVGINSTQ